MKNGNVISDINKIFVELKKFSPSFYSINPPVDNKLVERFEKEFQLELPADLKWINIY